jgi:hypothetical protein
MRAIPKDWQEAEKLGFTFEGGESTTSADGQTQRGTACMVLRGPSKPHPGGYTIQGDTLDSLDVPYTARLTWGRPRRERSKSAQPAHGGGVVTA